MQKTIFIMSKKFTILSASFATALMIGFSAEAASMPQKAPGATIAKSGKQFIYHEDEALKFYQDMCKTRQATSLGAPIEDPEGERLLYQRSCVSFYTYWGAQLSRDIENNIAEIINVDEHTLLLGNVVSESGIGGWCEAQREGNRIDIHCPQTIVDMDVEGIYEDPYHMAYYLMVLEEEYDAENDAWTYVPVEDEYQTYSFIVDEEGNLISEDASLMLGFCGYYDEWYSHIPLGTEGGHFEWVGLGDTDQVIQPLQFKATVPPAEMQLDTYGLIYMADFEVAASRKVKGGFYEGKFYLQGIYDSLPDCWIYGIVDGDKVTFPAQYIGPDYESWFLAFTLGYEVVPDPEYPVNDTWAVTDNAVLYYDKDKNLLTIPEKWGILINTNTDPNNVYYLTRLEQIKIKLQTATADFTPQAPSDMWGMAYNENFGAGMVGFSLNPVTADYIILDTDKISYELYYDGELQTFNLDGEITSRIPYEFGDDYGETGVIKYYNERSIYFGEPLETVGVRTIYTPEEGEPLFSEMAEIVFEGGGIDSVNSDSKPISEEYFDLTGRKISNPMESAIYIVRSTYSDGSVRTSKRMMK